MEKNYFIQLLNKYFTSELTTQEQEFVESYYDLFDNDPDVFEQLSPEEKERIRNEMRVMLKNSIEEEALSSRQKKSLSRKTLLFAAAAIIAIIMTVGLVYQSGIFAGKEIAEMASIHASKIQTIILSDGSKVMLFPGSKFSYPVSFAGKEKREVVLEGQAYFEITHKDLMPFVVRTGKLETKVLGTAFIIRAVPEDNDISVTVNRGKVQVSQEEKLLGVLKRDDQIVFNKQNGVVIHNVVNSDKLISWTRQELHVNNLTLAEAVTLLEKQFNVRIEIKDSLTDSKRFTATIPESETLDQALKIICEFNGVVYSYDDENEKVIIQNQPNRK